MNLQYILNNLFYTPSMFLGSLLSYYNLDGFFINANAFLFYALLCFFLYFTVRYLFFFRGISRKQFIKFFYRRFCRISHKYLIFIYNSSFFSGLLDRYMLACNTMYLSLYGKGNSVSLLREQIRAVSTDFRQIPIYFSGTFLFSVDRASFVFILRDMGYFLSKFRHTLDPERDAYFSRPFLSDLVDDIHSHSGVMALVNDYSIYNEVKVNFIDVDCYYDSKLLSYFDFSYYFKTPDDLRFFICLLDLMYFDFYVRYGKDLEFSDVSNLLRKFLVPLCHVNFFRYCLWSTFHYISFSSRDIFFLILVSFFGCCFFYFPFIIGILVLFYSYIFYSIDFYFFSCFFSTFFFGPVGLFFSFIFIFILLTSRFLNPFFYLSPFWIHLEKC